MNFLGHAVITAARDEDPAVVFGSMLPDFATMVGARLGAVHDPAVARGVQWHHATDEAFHGAPIFVELMGEARDDLESAGVSMGPALAVGHVGVELLLDGWLVDRGDAEARFDAAMARGAQLLDGFEARRSKTKDDATPAFAELVRRLAASPIPGAYRDAAFVADRMAMILDPRPRLRMSAEEVTLVHAWAPAARERVYERAPALMAELGARLQTPVDPV